MVRSLVMGFGAATMLAAAGSMTPAGQLILGAKHAAAAPPAAVVVQDQPAVRHVAAAKVAAKPVSRARPQVHRAAAARRTQPAPTPAGQSMNLGQLLPVLLQSQTSAASPFAGILGGGSPTSASSPLAGILSGGSSLPNLLQQATTPAQSAEPAPAPQSVQASSPNVPAPQSPRTARDD